MTFLKGRTASPGIVRGPAVLFRTGGKTAAAQAEQLSPSEEWERFEAACETAKEQLAALRERALETTGEEGALLFEVHQMLVDDDDFRDAVQASIDDGMPADEAAKAAGEEMASIFEGMEDEYMQARATDMRDIAGRVARCLRGEEDEVPRLTRPSVVVAEDLTPSQTIMMDKEMVLAFVTEKGSQNSHTAILSRTLGIPALIGVDLDCPELKDGVPLIVDGTEGLLILDPDEETETAYAARIEKLEKEKALLKEMTGLPSRTRDGRKVKIFANIGSPEDLPLVWKNDAEGIGLFRSEFLYIGRDSLPDEETQFQAYKAVAEGMKGKNVVIRTLDIGADKQASYLNIPAEDNPALGLRAIRLCLTRPEILRTQLRAIYRASAYGDISIMYPMIASSFEVLEAKQIAKEVAEELDREGIAHGDPQQGIMIETPAAAVMSGELAKIVDFFSIGTNDLTQYTLAVDRQNESLGRFCDRHHPAVLKLIELTARNAHENGIWVGICGELGADEELTEEFLRIGIDELSVSPSRVLSLRKKVRSL